MEYITLQVATDSLDITLNDYAANYVVDVIHIQQITYGPFSQDALSLTLKLTPKPKLTKFRRNLRGIK